MPCSGVKLDATLKHVVSLFIGVTCIALGVNMDILGGSTDWHSFLVFQVLVQRLQTEPPDDILVRGRRGGVAPWVLGENLTSLP